MARSTITLTFSATPEEADTIDRLAHVFADGSRSGVIRLGLQRLEAELSLARLANAAGHISEKRAAAGLSRDEVRNLVKETRARLAKNPAGRPPAPPSPASGMGTHAVL